MFVTLSLVVSVVVPIVVVIAALRRAPEAYENEQGLQIIQKRSSQVKRVALAKEFSRSLTPAPAGRWISQRSWCLIYCFGFDATRVIRAHRG
jgi:hypothetical protein